MSNESNREDRRTVSPSDLKASDFFPPGTGWNKDEESATPTPSRTRERPDDETAIDGRRPH
jgi:hypothetical protein